MSKLPKPSDEYHNGPRMLAAERSKAAFSVEKMRTLLDGKFGHVKRQVFEWMERDPLFRVNLATMSDTATHRQWATTALLKMCQDRLLKFEDYKREPQVFGEVLAAFSYLDGSLSVKMSVNHGLFGTAICNLGTEEQHQRFLPPIETGNLLGCFALTELLHGSNAQAVETIAEFDSRGGAEAKIVIRSPSESSAKWWIGNVAHDTEWAAVFAQLYVDGVHQGVHCILAQVREVDPVTGEKRACKGVTLGDCGPKIGLHGVDNGWMLFDALAVPRDQLLGRFGHINEHGKYVSQIASPGKRFSEMISALIGGRVFIIYSSTNVLKIALTIAIRYGAVRKQFGPPGGAEVPILNYRTHHMALMPLLAKCFAVDSIRYSVAAKLINAKITGSGTEDEIAELHMLSAGLKSLVSEESYNGIDVCRTLCGGHGYSAYSRLGQLRNDQDVQRTYEGANPVMMQQVAMVLLKSYNKEFGGGGVFGALKYTKRGIEQLVKHRNPFAVYNVDEAHLRSPQFHLDALQYRAAHLLNSLALRLKAATSSDNSSGSNNSASGAASNGNKKASKEAKLAKGVQFFNAWNECLPHTLHLGKAHMEYFLLSEFTKSITSQAAGDPAIQRQLHALRACYALTCILQDVEFFHAICAHNKIRAMRKLHQKLCAEIREQAVPLTDAFGIPDFVLNTPLAAEDGNIWPKYFDLVKKTPDYKQQIKSKL